MSIASNPNATPPPTAAPRPPRLEDLQRLRGQLERDRALPLETLRRRDRALGRGFAPLPPLQRLLAWLDHTAPEPDTPSVLAPRASLLAAMLAFASGSVAMGGFLLADPRGFVNALFLIAVFAALQAALSLASAFSLLRGSLFDLQIPRVRHPARWLLRSQATALFRDAPGLLGALVLLLGQLWGLLFSVGALLAFVVVPAVTELAFVWGSTFDLADAQLLGLAEAIAAPWRGWLSAAAPDLLLIEASRFRPGDLVLSASERAAMRGWWLYLFMTLLCYAVLPRAVLWAACRVQVRRRLSTALLALPGSELVLARLAEPLVETGGGDREPRARRPEAQHPDHLDTTALADYSLLLSWGGSAEALLEGAEAGTAGNLPAGRLTLGTGRFRDDRDRVAALDHEPGQMLALLARGWEPPVGELADLLGPLAQDTTLDIFLVPLPGRPLGEHQVDDWRRFGAGVSKRIQVRPLLPREQA